MSLTRHHQISTSHSSSGTGGGGGNIDALLEDLQKSVSRPGSSLGNMTNGYANSNGNVITTGFREFAKTTRTEKSGQPAETNKEYHIEYLNPANSTTVMAETKIPNFQSFKNIEHQKHNTILPPEQEGLKSYKEVQKSYQYNTNSHKTQSHTVPSGSDVTLKSNINELDSLLSDLNKVHKSGYSVDSVDHYRSNGIDGIEPLTTSTPRSGHVSRIEKKTFEEHRSHRVGDSAPTKTSDYKKELVFTGGSKDPSPARQIKDEYYYESRLTSGRSARDKSPPQDRVIYPPSSTPTSPTLGRRGVGSPSPVRYYTSTSSVRESSATPPPRTGVNQKVSSYESYNSNTMSSSSSHREPAVRHPPVKTPPPYRSPSPIAFNKQPDPNVNFGGKPLSPGTTRKFGNDQSKTVEKSYSSSKYNSLDRGKTTPSPTSNYSTIERNHTIDRYTSGGQPSDRYPPGGHPSDRYPPGGQPSDRYPPGSKYYTPETLTNVEESYTTSQIDQSNPTITHFPGGKIVEYRYKEESTTSTKYPPTITHHYPVEEQQPLLPRPFPTASPTPDSGEQRPPKRLDDLMASFSDSEYHTRTENYSRRQNESTNERYIKPTPEPAPQKVVQPVVTPKPHLPPPPPETPNPVNEAITISTNTKTKESISGPPVYYPPGVELFPNKREEMQVSSMEKNGKGMMKAKRKAKYEYEAGAKSKEKSSSGKTVVPVCLPLCCAAPCVIQ